MAAKSILCHKTRMATLAAVVRAGFFTHKTTGDCKHILEIRDRLAFSELEHENPPKIVLAKVREVTLKPETNEVLTPLVPIGDTHFAATVV